jgi:hypothetical protein
MGLVPTFVASTVTLKPNAAGDTLLIVTVVCAKAPPRGTCQKTQNESVAHGVLDTIALAVRANGFRDQVPKRFEPQSGISV